MVNERGTLFRLKGTTPLKRFLFYNLKSLKHQQQISIMSYFLSHVLARIASRKVLTNGIFFSFFFPYFGSSREYSGESNGASDYAYLLSTEVR